MILTFKQWKDHVIKTRMKRYNVSRADAEFFVLPNDWFNKHIEPALKDGHELPLPVIRSIADNGGGLSLAQINKFYPNAIPTGVAFDNGRVIQ